MLIQLKQQVSALNYNLKNTLKEFKARQINKEEVIKRLNYNVDDFKLILIDKFYNKD